MGMFSSRKPRRFRPVHIYTDEKREKLERMVEDIKIEQGILDPKEKKYDPTKFKGKFGQYTPRAQHYKESEHRLGWPLVVVLVMALLLVWRFLLSGTTHF